MTARSEAVDALVAAAVARQEALDEEDWEAVDKASEHLLFLSRNLVLAEPPDPAMPAMIPGVWITYQEAERRATIAFPGCSVEEVDTGDDAGDEFVVYTGYYARDGGA